MVVGFLPLMGWAGDTKNGKICWFILLAPKHLILLTILVGIIPLLVVIILYGIILYHALVKVMELRKLNSNSTNTATTTDGLRISRKTTLTTTTSVSTDSSTTDTNNAESTVRQRKGIFRKIFMQKPNSEIKAPSKWKAIKVVMFVTLSFVVTWVPYFVASLMYAFCDDKESERCNTLKVLVASPLAILGFFNSLLNPIIYAWWHQGFRNFVLMKLGKKKVAPTSTSSGSNSTKQTGNSSRKNSSQSSHEEAGMKMQDVDLTVH